MALWGGPRRVILLPGEGEGLGEGLKVHGITSSAPLTEPDGPYPAGGDKISAPFQFAGYPQLPVAGGSMANPRPAFSAGSSTRFFRMGCLRLVS
jgi:hypothetical protein